MSINIRAADSLESREGDRYIVRSPEEARSQWCGEKPRILGILFTHWQVSEGVPGTDACVTAAGQRRKVLLPYLGLDAFAGFSQIDQGSSCKNDLSDVLYFFPTGVI